MNIIGVLLWALDRQCSMGMTTPLAVSPCHYGAVLPILATVQSVSHFRLGDVG